ncbi:GNAT family N-acetyltransferase [Streptomyces sp. QL37]|uniref:bifunctional class I SAM-dependent methyltransferase/N-acetyltransferase n=1 Tax=Streptomyces sp. QL37 TaxID=2093747 RepID=UPI000CF1CCEA|nr:bifunctional class I SAM-dependent methyltransferase/N-acetyltransferase [Streptomyces sp. QL37]PPQ55937.1 transferase [Streptomyces sp. QL37]
MTDHTYDTPSRRRHRLPTKSPGSDATTLRLLALAGPLPDRPRVLDLGCGPGSAALLLAAEAGAQVTAVDPHQPFLDELTETAAARGLGDLIRTVRADTAGLVGAGFADGSYDLVRAEGSAYLTGSDTALRDLRRLLAPGGSMVITGCDRATGSPSLAVEAGCHVVGVATEPGGDRDSYVLRPFDPRWRTRPETAADRDAVHGVVAAAFPTRDEADLVDALRRDPGAWMPGLSYVAEARDGSVAAHALLTRCHVGDAPALALAPVATSPGHQRGGAGRAVVRAVLDAARLRGESLVLVLGHPEYYPAFGFVPASRFGIRPGFEVPDEAMMALVMDDSVPVPSGTIRYAAAFGV